MFIGVALEWVEWRIGVWKLECGSWSVEVGVWKLECGVRVGMFAGCAMFEEVVWRVSIEGDDGYFWGMCVALVGCAVFEVGVYGGVESVVAGVMGNDGDIGE